MGRVNTPVLTLDEETELERGFKEDKRHCFRMRCKLILLKAKGMKSNDVGEIIGMNYVSVNAWVKRFKTEGVTGLATRPGRGCKPIISLSEDSDEILEIIKKNRQRMDMAKQEWEESSGKTVCRETFRRFLKVLAEDIKE